MFLLPSVGQLPLAWDRRRESATLLQNRNAFGHAFIKDIAGNAGDKPLQPTFPDKGGRLRSLLFCNRIARKRDTKNAPRRQRTEMTPPLPDPAHGLIRRMGPICADFGGC